jgi:membrane protein
MPSARADPSFSSRLKVVFYRAALVAYARYRDDLLSLQAMSLTYTTLLSLVPFLAVTFSVLKAFGVQNFAEPFLASMLEPLGSQGSEVTKRILGFVNNIRVGILGAVGMTMLFYTVVSLVAQMEDALNRIWHLPLSRSWSQRFAAYLSVVLVGPVMVFAAFALTASAQSYWLVERLFEIRVFDFLFTFVTAIMPFVMLCATFTFVYKLLPYTQVRFASALVGGATAAILWQVVGTGFAAFVANSARYAAIYSSFAIIILFLIWLYVGWLIFLVGGEVAYLHQYPHRFVQDALYQKQEHGFREWLALSVLEEITRRHLSDRPPPTELELAALLGVSSVEEFIEMFVGAGLLLRCSEPKGVALARPPEHVSVNEVLDIVRGEGENPETKTAKSPVPEILNRRDQAVARALEDTTLRSLVSDPQIKRLRVAQTGSESTHTEF